MNVYIPSTGFATQGPCPTGFHVPLSSEWSGLKTIMDGLSLTTGDNWRINLHMPFAGYRERTAAIDVQGSRGEYWSSSPLRSDMPDYAMEFFLTSSIARTNGNLRARGFSIRCFKDSFTVPTSSWTVINGTLGSAGIFWNQTDGLISITSDGTTGYTIQDKNLGATTVYNDGDTLAQTNMGNMYQWGNNYGFPSTGSVTTSSTQVNAQNYGPGNYYESDTFITRSSSPYDWSSVQNDNLRGGTDGNVPVTTMKEVQNIYIGEYSGAYKGEYIEYKINADGGGRLYIPLGGYSSSGQVNCPYNWKVSVDGGTETTYSGTGASGTYIRLSGYGANTNHTIKIVPTTADYGWARAYCWNGSSNYITEIVYDSSYMGYAVSATDTGNYFRNAQYKGCNQLTKPAEEYLPDTVTTIGNNFMYYAYNGCTSLTYASEESLPSSVTSIGSSFRKSQYQGCTSLTEIKGWKDLSIGNSTFYRHYQFYGNSSNKTVKVLSDVGYSSYDSNTLADGYVTSVYVPNAYLTNFKNTSNYPWANITDSKFIGY